MFARLLEMTVKPEKKSEFLDKVREEITPILSQYRGFISIFQLEVEADSTKMYAITFWNEKQDAEKYEKENFAKVAAIYEPLLAKPALVRRCKVSETIYKKNVTLAA
jgi:heme-degrading monooxygenase HmoA